MSARDDDDQRGKPTWRPPTRRMFVGMLGAAVAAFAVREVATTPAEPERSTWSGKTRWIGHC